MYHCVESCNKCNGNNELINPSYESQFLHETETKCESCGHNDYWADGYFESSQDGLNKCDKYYFDDDNIFHIVRSGED